MTRKFCKHRVACVDILVCLCVCECVFVCVCVCVRDESTYTVYTVYMVIVCISAHKESIIHCRPSLLE